MRTFIVSIVFVLLFQDLLFAQFIEKESKKQIKINKFSLSSFSYACNIDSLTIVAFLEIPYSVLQFVKKRNGYIAYYQATLSAKNTDGFQIENSVWRDSIIVDEYFDTKSWILNRKHFSSFKVQKLKKYEVVGELQDLDTRKKGIKKETLPFIFKENQLGLLPPTFLLDLKGKWGFKDGKIPTHGIIVKEIGRGVELNVSGFVGKSPYELEVVLTNDTVNDSLIIKEKYQHKRGYFNEYFFIPANVMNSLKNDFSIILTQDSKNKQKNISFSKFKSGISSYISNIDLAIKQMKYIIDDDKYKSSNKKFRKDKENLFYSLWKDMDPTPNTDFNELMDEYYKRVLYANENFDGWKDGWETDRGMIYILFGPPDQVERTNPSMANSTLYQIWTYNRISKQFIFKDQNGFGDFRLDSPLNGIGIR